MAFPPKQEVGSDHDKNWAEDSSRDPAAFCDGLVLPFRTFIRLIQLLHKDPEFEAITELDQSWLAGLPTGADGQPLRIAEAF